MGLSLLKVVLDTCPNTKKRIFQNKDESNRREGQSRAIKKPKMKGILLKRPLPTTFCGLSHKQIKKCLIRNLSIWKYSPRNKFKSKTSLWLQWRLETWIMSKLSKIVKIGQKLSKIVKIVKNCQKLSKSVKNCQKLSKIVKNFKNCQQLSKCWSGHVSSSLWSNVSKVTGL